MIKLLSHQKGRLIFIMRVSLINMILSSLLITIGYANDVSAQELLNRKVTLNVKDMAMKQVLEEIENKTHVKFTYRPKLVQAKKKVTINVVDFKVHQVLDSLFNTDVTYEVVGDQIVIVPTTNVGAYRVNKKTGTQPVAVLVTGKITDETGSAIPGVNILEKGTTNGTTSDTDGVYNINVADGNAILVFSFIGFATQELSVANQSTMNVSLVTDTQTLSEVVVVGYGTQKKLNLTAAVDQVNGDVLQNRPMTNVTQGLQGVLPNLNIRLLDGKPNQAPSYNIRGTTSIGQGGSALVLIDGVEGDPSILNPNDIASVSLLKDAAAASIYGARGVFGVVLITTKTPAKDKTTVSFSTNFAKKSPISDPDFVTDGYTNAKMFAESFINREGTFPQNMNKTLKFSQAYLDDFKAKVESGQPYNEVEIDPVTGEYVYYGSTDWYGLLYKKNLNYFENNISVSSSGPKTSFMISGRFLNQDGLFRYNSDDYSMKNFRAKGSIQLTPWLRLDNNMDYTDQDYHNPLNVGEGGGIWRNIADEGHSNGAMFNPDGTLTLEAVYHVGDFWYGKNGIDTRKRVIRNTAGFATTFFNDKFRVNGNFTFRNTDNSISQKRVQVPYSVKPGATAFVGTTTNDLKQERNENQYIASNLYTEYENTFNSAHYLKVLVGYNYEQSTFQSGSAQRNGIIYPDANNLNLALGASSSIVGGYEKWVVLGGFSRINYAYKDRYLLEVNGRYDGSSKFPENQRFAFFPSVSGGWRVSEEPFWNVAPKILSDVKVRGSYGSLGNGSIASYVYQEQLAIALSSHILNGTRPNYTNNPSVIPDGLTWETATTTDIGFDFGMLDNRLTFVGDWFVRKTTDMYTIGLTPPAIFGATAPKGNYADLETKGWELSLNWRDKLTLAKKQFGYTVRFTLADSRSVITKYNNPNKLLNDYYEGQVIGEIWGYQTEGFFVDQADIDSHAKQSPQFTAAANGVWAPGDIKFADTNGDGVINPGTNRVSDPGDRSIIGNSTPRYTYGITLGANWNNFYLTTFFQGVLDQDWYPSTEAQFFWGQYNRPYNQVPAFQLGNIWTPENPDAYFPRYMSRAAASSTTRTLGAPQTRYLQNVSYIRLKNVQIGYNLPKEVASKIKATDVRVYFSGENLWTNSPLQKLVKGLDVENIGPSDQLFTTSNAGDGYNYPMLKSYSVGLNIVF
jgi:TonB-linked SusC/RagA family outer membrane protein